MFKSFQVSTVGFLALLMASVVFVSCQNSGQSDIKPGTLGQPNTDLNCAEGSQYYISTNTHGYINVPHKFEIAAYNSDCMGAISSVTWDFGNYAAGFTTPIEHTYAGAGNYEINAQLVDASGKMQSLGPTRVIIEEPNNCSGANGIRISGNSTVIAGQNISLTAAPLGCLEPTSYSWKNSLSGNNILSTRKNYSDTFYSLGPVTVTLYVKSTEGAYSDTHQIKVFESCGMNQEILPNSYACTCVDGYEDPDNDKNCTLIEGGNSPGGCSGGMYKPDGSDKCTAITSDVRYSPDNDDGDYSCRQNSKNNLINEGLSGADESSDCRCNLGRYRHYSSICLKPPTGTFSRDRSDITENCTNKPSNSHYRENDWATGINNCPWDCNDGYERVSGTCKLK